MSISSLESRFVAGDERALARGISLLEAGDAAGIALLGAVRGRGDAHIVGITGSPGSGKSTLVDALVLAARALDKRVAVLAVDPSSPYSGGAILGDRIRMMRHHQDRGVFIRSMATRGHLGGLAAATLQVTALLEAFGFDLILIETVGVGQSEIDIVRAADSTVLVLTPGQGDGVQAFKAGIMEIADVFVVNKFDQPGGGRLTREIKAALGLAMPEAGAWQPPVLETVASEGKGVTGLLETLETHREALEASGELERVRQERVRFEVSALLTERLRRLVADVELQHFEAVLSGRLSTRELADMLLRELVRERSLPV